MQSIGILYDILFAVVLIAAAVRGHKCGLVSGLIGLAGSAAGIVGGVYATRSWAPALYADYVGVHIGETVAAALEKTGGDLTKAIESVSFLPEEARRTLSSLLTGAADSAVPQIVSALEPVFLPLIQAVLFFAVWVLVRALARFLSHLLRGVNAVPLLGGMNRLLGLAFGVVSGLLNCWVLSIVLWAAANLTGGRLSLLTIGALNQSTVYSLLLKLNPFLTHY